MIQKPEEIKLLLVDDEVDFLHAAKGALARQGFSVTTAESGERAVELMRFQRPDMVILDLRMEGMDGISTLTEIRKIDPKLPVLILTGHGQFQDALDGIRLKVVDFVQKPVDMRDLGGRIQRFFTQGKVDSLREKSIGELMVPADCYQRIYLDASMQEAADALVGVMHKQGEGLRQDRGRRALLVFDRDEMFVGVVRAEDLARTMIPGFLLDSPYSSYFTGMFLAQSKVVGRIAVSEIVQRHEGVDIQAPLMEALHLMITQHLSHLPVLQQGGLVGLLRPEDMVGEIANSSGD